MAIAKTRRREKAEIFDNGNEKRPMSQDTVLKVQRGGVMRRFGDAENCAKMVQYCAIIIFFSKNMPCFLGQIGHASSLSDM